MKITLKDGSVKEYSEAKSVYDIAADISEGLARVACAGEVDGEVGLQHRADSFRPCRHPAAQAHELLYPMCPAQLRPADRDHGSPVCRPERGLRGKSWL